MSGQPPPPLQPGWQPANPASFDQATMNQAAMDQVAMNQATMDQAAMDQVAMNQATMDQAAMNQAAMDQVAMNQAAFHQAAVNRNQAAMNQATMDQAAMNQAAMDQVAMNQAAFHQAAVNRNQAAMNQAMNQASMNQAAVQGAIYRAPTNPTVLQTPRPILAVEETINAATFVHEHKEWLDKLLLPSPPMAELLPKIFSNITHETIRVLPSEYNDKLYEIFRRMGDHERSDWCLQETINQCVVTRNLRLPDNFVPDRFHVIADRLWTIGHDLNCAEVPQGREIERLSWELYAMMIVFDRENSRNIKSIVARQGRNQLPNVNQGLGTNQPPGNANQPR